MTPTHETYNQLSRVYTSIGIVPPASHNHTLKGNGLPDFFCGPLLVLRGLAHARWPSRAIVSVDQPEVFASRRKRSPGTVRNADSRPSSSFGVPGDGDGARIRLLLVSVNSAAANWMVYVENLPGPITDVSKSSAGLRHLHSQTMELTDTPSLGSWRRSRAGVNGGGSVPS